MQISTSWPNYLYRERLSKLFEWIFTDGSTRKKL